MIKIKEIITPFGKSGNIYLIGAITQGLAPILLTPFLTRSISTNEFGQITILNSVSVIISILLSFGVPIVISRSYILDKNVKTSLDNLVNFSIYIYLILSILTFSLYKLSNSIYFLVFSTSLLLAIYQIGLPTFRARNQSTLFALYSFLNTVLPTLFILVFSKQSFQIYDLFITGLLLSAIFASFFLIKKNNKKLELFFISRTIRSSLPILPHMLGMIALVNIDKVLFGYLRNEIIAGYLQVIMLIGLSPIFILSALNHAWLNQILKQLQQSNKKSIIQINSTIHNLFIICFLLIIFLFISLGALFKILNPNIYLDLNIYKTVILTSIISFLYVIYLANTHILTWSKNFWILGISTPFAVLIQSLTIYFLIDKFLYLSAAIGVGAALTFQLMILEIFNLYKKNNYIIKTKYKLFAVVLAWFTCFLTVL